VAEVTLSTRDICKLIATCHKSGVTEFKFGTLQMNFREPEKLTEESTLPAAIPEEIQRKFNEETLAVQKLDDEIDQTSFLLIEDPLDMERRIADGELIDEGRNA
jgi:hypothetical protein